MPVSQASEYIVTVGLVNVMLLISIPLLLTASSKVIHNCKSALCVLFGICGPCCWDLDRKSRRRFRKYLSWEIMCAAWFKRTIIDSRVLLSTFPFFNISHISSSHWRDLSLGKYILNSLVSTCYPRMFCDYVGVPSNSSFLILVASSRGIGSALFVGRNIVWTANGAAFWPFSVQFSLFSITVIISSMYPFAIVGWNGTSTKSGREFCIDLLEDGNGSLNLGFSGEYIAWGTMFVT